MKRIESLFATVAAIALFAMMVLTFADVVGRKFFDNSLTGAVELTEIFMTLMIYFALPLASLVGEHIVFDLLDKLMPAALLRWQKAASHGLTAAVLLGAAWVVRERAARTMEYGDMTATLEIKLWPFHSLVAVMLVVTAVVHLWLAWRSTHTERGAAA
ncbi:TRAP transporter small permease [Piscinibacter sakaiensis]|uniref:TRAP transporter small permease n=1 Tax=Piscinibacter sakaiensis TaxID=1547922 RepID=UPI003AAB044F